MTSRVLLAVEDHHTVQICFREQLGMAQVLRIVKGHERGTLVRLLLLLALALLYFVLKRIAHTLEQVGMDILA